MSTSSLCLLQESVVHCHSIRQRPQEYLSTAAITPPAHNIPVMGRYPIKPNWPITTIIMVERTRLQLVQSSPQFSGNRITASLTEAQCAVEYSSPPMGDATVCEI